MAKRIVNKEVGLLGQHYPALAVIVTVKGADGQPNAMTAAWHTCLSFRPPLYGVSLLNRRTTYKLIKESGEFAVNFMPYQQCGLLAGVGATSGKAENKFEKFQIKTVKSAATQAPVLAEAYCVYECKLNNDISFGDHSLIVGEVVAVQSQAGAFDVNSNVNLFQVSPALYLGGDWYATTDKSSGAIFDRGMYGK